MKPKAATPSTLAGAGVAAIWVGGRLTAEWQRVSCVQASFFCIPRSLSHTFRHLDAENAHSEAYHLCHVGTEHEAEVAFRGVFLAQNGVFMIELVVFFHKVIAIVGYH